MKLYLAAVYTNSYMPGQRLYEAFNDYEKCLIDKEVKPHTILESWHYVKAQKYVDDIRNIGGKVFLDSGAYSAHTLGATLSVKDYCAYIHRNTDILLHDDGVMLASVLDGIGDPLQTWRNHLEMEARGVTPLPCFHAGEDERYLEYYVANFPYITLGGMVGASVQQLQLWLDRVWDKYLVDGSGNPKVKVHGFGITSVPLMRRYPWYSCDSSTWVQNTAFGSVVTPHYGPVAVSEKSPQRHTAGYHVSNLSYIENEYMINYLNAQGFEYERLSQVYQSRAAYNLWAFTEIERLINAENVITFKTPAQELFN